MRVTLPSALIAIVIGACTRSQPPVAPGPPIAADPPVSLKSMTEECDAMVAALGAFKACPNLDEDNREDLEAWIERANQDFTAGRKVTLAADAQQAIALACRRGTNSVTAATQRCHAGRRPKTD
jgi:hypothetical protein